MCVLVFFFLMIYGADFNPHRLSVRIEGAFVSQVDHRIHNNVACDEISVHCASLRGRLNRYSWVDALR